MRERGTIKKDERESAAVRRSISIANCHPRLRLNRREIARLIETLDANGTAIGVEPSVIPSGELSLVFLTDAALAKLHGDFLDDPSTTDVITFEGDPTLGTAGEICVSADTAAAYAREHRRDFNEELTLYLVHGWLHLAGYDDLKPAKKRAMRRAEARALRVLERADALPRFSLRPAHRS
jgi:probable rRNA maturation factor